MTDINVERISHILDEKFIILVCGGGIGVIEMPRVARELRRHGAKVQFVVTQKCLEFIGMTSLEWSSQNSVVVEPSGISEHICTADAILIAPATANLLSQIRYGLCTNGATTLVQSALGQHIPIVMIPTMHDSMWNSPIIKDNVEFLKTLKNVFFIAPRQEEDKQKLPPPEDIALVFAHYVNKFIRHEIKSVMITLGGTRTMIDPVRCLTNISSGRLGVETAKIFYAYGHNVTIVAAQTNFELKKYQDLILYQHEDYHELYEFLKKINFDHTDGFFHFLAGSDYAPSQTNPHKINSCKKNVTLHLEQLPKIRDLENIQNIPFKFFCKLTTSEDNETKNQIKKIMQFHHVKSMFWNTPENAWSKDRPHTGFLITRKDKQFTFTKVSGKKNIAQKIYDAFNENC